MTIWWAQCRREWLEHQLSLFWTPVAALTVIVLFFTAMAWKINSSDLSAFATSDDRPRYGVTASQNSNDTITAVDGATVVDGVAVPGAIMSIALGLSQYASLFCWIYFITGGIVLLNSVFDERRDHSVLFWKSMPVSDRTTILSKLFTITVTSAGVTALCAFIAQLYGVYLTLNWNPIHAFGPDASWANAHLQILLPHWLIGIFTQAFWTLPVWGWALMISACSRIVPSLWGIAIPIATYLATTTLFDAPEVARNMLSHATMVALPGESNHSTMTSLLSYQWEIWSSASMWIGILIGVAFIYAAIVLRQRNNQL